VELTACLHLMPRLRMFGAKTPFIADVKNVGGWIILSLVPRLEVCGFRHPFITDVNIVWSFRCN
jgi:hypothetical protein